MSRRILILTLALALVGAVPGRARAQAVEAESSTHVAHGALAQQPLRPGDVVRLRIWREPDLSGDFQVDETGVVVFPLIGPRTVTEVPPDSLRHQLVDAYATYLRHPSIDVVLLRRVNVLGAVAKAGLYPVDPTMTIADVLALAGGPTTIGDPDKVRIIRDGETITASVGQRTVVGELPVRSGDQFYVPERSWISRNSNIVAAAITGTISLIIAVWVR